MRQVGIVALLGFLGSVVAGAQTPITDGELDVFSSSRDARVAGIVGYRYARDGSRIEIEVLGPSISAPGWQVADP